MNGGFKCSLKGVLREMVRMFEWTFEGVLMEIVGVGMEFKWSLNGNRSGVGMDF